MLVNRIFSTNPDQPSTSPFPVKNGILLELRTGDVCDPIGIGSNWFNPPFPKYVLRYFSRIPLPYIAARFGAIGFYAGWKIYGVDAPEYKQWLCKPEEVYDGSLAMCFTIRFSRHIT